MPLTAGGGVEFPDPRISGRQGGAVKYLISDNMRDPVQDSDQMIVDRWHQTDTSTSAELVIRLRRRDLSRAGSASLAVSPVGRRLRATRLAAGRSIVKHCAG